MNTPNLKQALREWRRLGGTYTQLRRTGEYSLSPPGGGPTLLINARRKDTPMELKVRIRRLQEARERPLQRLTLPSTTDPRPGPATLAFAATTLEPITHPTPPVEEPAPTPAPPLKEEEPPVPDPQPTTDLITITDPGALIALRTRYQSDIDAAIAMKSEAESHLAAVNDRLRTIASDLQSLLRSINLPVPTSTLPPPNTSRNPALERLLHFIRTSPPNTVFTLDTLTPVHGGTRSTCGQQVTAHLIPRNYLVVAPGYPRGYWHRGPTL